MASAAESAEAAEPGLAQTAASEPAQTSDPVETDPTEPSTGNDEGAAEDAQPSSGRRRPPEQTRDDTDAGWGEYADRSAHDRWLEEQRPPHWE